MTFILQWFDGCDPNSWVEITLLYERDKSRWPLTGWIQIRDLVEKLPVACEWAAKKNPQGYGVFVGYGTRKERKPKPKRGGKTDIAQLPGVWVDLDDHDIERAAETACRANPRPTWIMATGGGVHAGWKFDQPITITDDNRHTWGWTLKGLAESLGADTQTDISKMMRWPSFVNRKPERDSFQVFLFDWDTHDIGGTGQTVDALEFVPYAGLGKPAPPNGHYCGQNNGHFNGHPPPLVRQFLENGAPEGTRNRELFRAVCSLRSTGHEPGHDFVQDVRDKAEALGLPPNEIDNVVRSAYKYGE
jgi:hypothetical protein